MPTKYLLRFDDITPRMAWSKFKPLKIKLEKLGIKSILGVVPKCKDPTLNVENPNTEFFDSIRHYAEYGDAISQHGTYHLYTTNSPGNLRINNRSEFSGLDFEHQHQLISTGKNILISEDVWQPYFMAPAHSFDDTTIDALRKLNFLAITDGYGLFPRKYRGIIQVPQLSSKPLSIGFGLSTICLHINSMTDHEINKIGEFAVENKSHFLDFREVVSNFKENTIASSLTHTFTSASIMCYRKINRLLKERKI